GHEERRAHDYARHEDRPRLHDGGRTHAAAATAAGRARGTRRPRCRHPWIVHDPRDREVRASASIATLYVEELKALTRGHFAWLGAGVVLLAIGGLATVGTQDTWLDGYGIVAYGVVPLAFIPFAAVALASPRANRFVESIFTAPVDRRDWLVAKVL